MKTMLLISTGLLIAVMSQAQIIHVPADYPTIQQGINAAQNGDTVLVSDGIYYEQINFLGKKPLVVASEFLTTGDTSHIANTIIDGSQIPAGDSCSVVYFINGEDSTSVLCGFTIQGGNGTYWYYWGSKSGGGVFCLNGASILNNIIQNNEVIVTTNNAGGGGILVVSTSPVHITDNIIRNNSADCQSPGNAWAGGGGIFCVLSNECIHTISNNLIQGNVINVNSSYGGGGAGILLQECSVLLDNNILINNSCTNGTSAFSSGGGLNWWIYYAGSSILNNSFINNTAGTEGGGIIVNSTNNLKLPINNNYFINNHAGTYGGAIKETNSIIRLENNVFSGNQAGQFGGACYFRRNNMIDHTLILINNSFYNNQSVSGGAIYSIRKRPIILNTIFWNDVATNAGQEIYLNIDTAEIAYSNIDMSLIHIVNGDAIDGGGNINTDPFFDDPDLLTLNNWSPCVNAGTDEFTCECGEHFLIPEYDIEGNPRPWFGGVDMGAYEEDLSTVIQNPISNGGSSVSVYPNPSKDKITISSPAITGNTLLSIFNVSGEKVLEMQLTETETQLDISALSRGVYFVRIQDEKGMQVGKIMKQ